MKASELRIGNYYNQFGNTEQVCHVVIKNLTEAPNGQLWCKPIPLTEEWLLRMGFELNFGDYLLKTNRGIILIEEDLAEISFNEYQSGFNAPCKYIHQLQNLYYALTNQELEIKEL